VILVPNTLFVGIDVSSDSCEVAFVDDQGKQLGRSFSVTNDLDGACKVGEMVCLSAEAHEASEVKIGLESTSVYGWHLRDFLFDLDTLKKYSPLVYEINPSMVASFKKSFSHKPKTDSLDAFAIAQRVRFGGLRPYSKTQMTTAPLQQLTRLRLHLVQTLAAEQNRALGLLFLKFSAYKQASPFSKVFGKASTAVLEEFTSEELAAHGVKDLAAFILKNGNNRLKDPEEAAKVIQAAARRSYRLNSKMQDAVDVTLSLTLQNVEFLRSQVKKADAVIARELEAFPQTLTTVPGLGPVLVAGIVSEIGDIFRFKDKGALAQFTGLTWTKYQSGGFDAEEHSLTKTGNKYLRYYLVEAANSLRVHNEEYKRFYQRKYQEVPKHQHKRALVLTARKLVNLVFSMLRKGQIYRPEVMRETV
jgi:transposase